MAGPDQKRAMRTLYRFAVAALMAIIPSLPAFAAAETASPNYQGLWWNSPPESESGWGINLAHQGDIIFATWYTYDADGKGWWLSMTAYKTAERTYSGTLIEASGPAFSAVPFNPDRVTRNAVGVGTFVFRDLDSGTFTYTVKGEQQTKFITRMAYGPVPTCTEGTRAELVAAKNYQDLWWVPDGTESGWGINLAHQGDIVFATWYTYGGDGRPQWLSATAFPIGQGIYSGQLIRTTGPAFKASPFDPAMVTRSVVGTATFTFANGNSGQFEYTLDGVHQAKAITRLMFSATTGTRCGEPHRNVAPVTVVAVGDIAECGDKPAGQSGAARTAELVRDSDSLILTLGDNAYQTGTPDEFANCYHPTWGRFKDRTRPTPGNHDYYTTGAEGYFDYFGDRAGPDRRGYYSFDHGSWHFISLNSMADLSPQSEQYRWLLADLEKSRDSLCTIAVLHYPAFNSGAAHGSNATSKQVFETLRNAGVELLLSGHEHVYERFGPQKGDGTSDPARGVRQFVVGTGGASLHQFSATLPHSQFRLATSWGILRLALGHGSYSWQFVPAGGGTPLDAGSANCHR